MKTIITSLVLLLASVGYAQDFNLSTLKMGTYSLKMPKEDAEKIAERKLIVPTEQNEYNGESNVFYHGEQIKISVTQNYFTENASPESYVLYSLSTTSKKFKTKSGIGIGNTRNDLINTYRDYPNFSIHEGWTDEGERDLSISYFSMEDFDAGTMMTFKLSNNRVVEITISINEDGC